MKIIVFGLAALFSSSLSMHITHAEGQGDVTRAQAAQLFQSIDADGDKVLTNSELQKFSSSLYSCLASLQNQEEQQNGMTGAQADQLFKSVDSNGDDQLSQSEIQEFNPRLYDCFKSRFER